MKINQITEKLAVSPQIKISDVARIKNLGFKAIICNRPDEEEVGQPGHKEITSAAIKHGIQYIYLPVLTTDVSEESVNKFKSLLEELPEPTLAYCRTGTRSAVLWALGEVKECGIAEVMNKTQNAGYDLSKELQSKTR